MVVRIDGTPRLQMLRFLLGGRIAGWCVINEMAR